jgi:hypothetical protein
VSLRVDVGRLFESLNIEGRKRGNEWFALCPNPEHDDHKPTTGLVGIEAMRSTSRRTGSGSATTQQ